MTSETVTVSERGLIEVKPGIFEVKGFSFPGVVYGISGEARGNFSFTYSGGQDNLVAQRRHALVTDLGIDAGKVVQMNIIQGKKIAVVSRENAFDIANNDDSLILPDTDAMITNEKGVALLLLTADCVPVILFDSENGVLALAHVGRKGAALNLPMEVVKQMVLKYGSMPSGITAAIGPAIGPECYLFKEIPEEHRGPEWEQYIHQYPEHPGQYGLDFVGFAVDSLRAINVKVAEAKLCVGHEKGFFSHRASTQSNNSIPEKRFATLVAMK